MSAAWRQLKKWLEVGDHQAVGIAVCVLGGGQWSEQRRHEAYPNLPPLCRRCKLVPAKYARAEPPVQQDWRWEGAVPDSIVSVVAAPDDSGGLHSSDCRLRRAAAVLGRQTVPRSELAGAVHAASEETVQPGPRPNGVPDGCGPGSGDGSELHATGTAGTCGVACSQYMCQAYG